MSPLPFGFDLYESDARSYALRRCVGPRQVASYGGVSQAPRRTGTPPIERAALVGVSPYDQPGEDSIPARGRQPGQAATVQRLAERATGYLHDATDGVGHDAPQGKADRSFSARCHTTSRYT